MIQERETPAALPGAPGLNAMDGTRASKIDGPPPGRKPNANHIAVRVNGAERSFRGRCAWTLLRLVEAGEQGCTPIEEPAPRWSHYVFRLRRNGVSIETITEKHGGAYAGTHARYVLRSPVEIIETREAA